MSNDLRRIAESWPFRKSHIGTPLEKETTPHVLENRVFAIHLEHLCGQSPHNR
jgi:hypothetical protein